MTVDETAMYGVDEESHECDRYEQALVMGDQEPWLVVN